MFIWRLLQRPNKRPNSARMSKLQKSFDTKTSQFRRRNSVSSALFWGVAAGAALVAAAAFLAYQPCLTGGFIWDDHDLITNNELIKDSGGPFRIWCTTDPVDFWPMTNSTFWIEWRLWEMNSAGYHVTNMILHVVEALLVWTVLRRLSIPGAYLAAMIFALHPVNVESVAWIAQRKNLMAMLFFLISILWYLKSIKWALGAHPNGAQRALGRETASDLIHHSSFIPHPSSFRWYWLSLAAFVLAMLSKGSVAVLPVLLMGITWWLSTQEIVPIIEPRRTRLLVYLRRYVWPMAPFFLVALVFTAVNMFFQTIGLQEAIRVADYTQRLLGAGCVVWFYLYKALFPIDLSFVYAHWDIEAGNVLWWIPLFSALVVTAVLWLYRKSWSRGLLFAWGFFCVALLPVMGFSDVFFMRYALVADHYQHIAIIAAIGLASAFWAAWHRPASGWVRGAARAAAIAALGSLAFLTWQQSRQYLDEYTLFNDTIRKSPDCWMAHLNLGKALVDADRLQDAMDHFRQALVIKPDCVAAYNDLGNVFLRIGQANEAIENYRQALSIKPDYPNALNNMGNALNEIGRPEEAIEYCEKALRINPGYYEAWFNLGNSYLNTGRPQQAIEYYQQALELKADYPEALNNLGNALNQAGRPQEAIGRFQAALRLKPDFAEAHLNMGNALLSLGRLPESAEQYRKALALKPDCAQAHNNLGGILYNAGKRREAIEHFNQALRLKPQYPDVYYNLALAYADMRQTSEAMAAAGKALELARSQRQSALVKRIEDWLKSYGGGAPDEGKAPPANERATPR